MRFIYRQKFISAQKMIVIIMVSPKNKKIKGVRKETRSEYRCGRKQVRRDQALDGDLGIKRFPTAATDVGKQDIYVCVLRTARRSSARGCVRQHATLSNAISHPLMSSTRNGCNRAYCIQIKRSIL